MISVAAGLGFGHVEQPDPIQSSGWTRISVQLAGLDKDFCPNPRKLYVTGSVSSGSGCPTRGLGWRICPTRGSDLNICPKPNSTARLRMIKNLMTCRYFMQWFVVFKCFKSKLIKCRVNSNTILIIFDRVIMTK